MIYYSVNEEILLRLREKLGRSPERKSNDPGTVSDWQKGYGINVCAASKEESERVLCVPKTR